MSPVAIDYDVRDRDVRRSLKMLSKAMRQSSGARKIAGRSGQNYIKAHLRKLDKERRNKLGGKRSHFYAQAAKATNYRETSDGVEYVVSHLGMAQRYFGGRIEPVNASKLAIPAIKKAYGKSPREFNDLEPMIRHRAGRPQAIALVQRAQTRLAYTKKGIRKHRSLGGKVFFWLVNSVQQKGDKSVLPKAEDLIQHVTSDVKEYVRLQLERKQNN